MIQFHDKNCGSNTFKLVILLDDFIYLQVIGIRNLDSKLLFNKIHWLLPLQHNNLILFSEFASFASPRTKFQFVHLIKAHDASKTMKILNQNKAQRRNNIVLKLLQPSGSSGIYSYSS